MIAYLHLQRNRDMSLILSAQIQSSSYAQCRKLSFPLVRLFSLSQVCCKKPKKKTLREELKSKYRNLVVPEEDLNKKPSDLEIKQKELPENTPTLGERLNRDVYRLFHQADEKHGYHNLRKFPDSLKTEVMEDVKEKLNRNIHTFHKHP